MRAHAGLAALAFAATTPLAVNAVAPPGDGPTREPVEAWSTAVECVAGSGPSGRGCTVEVADSAVYVLEHAPASDPAVARLAAYDPVTGAERWQVVTGPAERMTISHEAIVLGDKSHVEVVDPDTGALRFTHPGRLVGVNDYGVVLVAAAAVTAEQPAIEALDGVTGTSRWTVPSGLDVGAVCRDIVVLVPARGAAAQPFQVVEHHTGVVRWSGEEPFDPATDTLQCSGPWLYTTDGHSLIEWDSVIGWLNWETPLDGGAASVELYRDAALVTSDDGGTVTAVERETGEQLWERPAAELGSVVSPRARLRRDGATVFTVHPLTGDVVQRVDLHPPAGTTVRFVAASECRLVVTAGATVTTFGVRDLAPAWTLELDAVPDDVAVAAGTLVVRTGDRLAGLRSGPSESGDPGSDALSRCTF